MKWYQDVVNKRPVTAEGEIPPKPTWGDPFVDLDEGRAAGLQARILKLLPKETYNLAAIEKILKNPESIRAIAANPTMIEQMATLTPEQRKAMTRFVTMATSDATLWGKIGELTKPQAAAPTSPAAPAPAGGPKQRAPNPGMQDPNLKNMPSVTTPAPAINQRDQSIFPDPLSPYQQRLKGQQSI
jgi:hypothetical protein